MLPLGPMNDHSATGIPRIKRDEIPPPAPLDPYVTTLLRWIAGQELGVNPNTIAKLSSAALNWPPPFAEAIVTAAHARRVLTLFQATSRGGYRTTLSTRGQDWLARNPIEPVDVQPESDQ